MTEVSDRLWKAVEEVVGLRSPSIAKILRRRGFNYEADRMDELIGALDEMKERIRGEEPPTQ